MINEERIRLMTKACIYEQQEKRKSLHIVSYYRKDYVGLHMIMAWIFATILVGLAGLLTLAYLTEQTTSVFLNFSNLTVLFIILGTAYLLVVAVYMAISYICYAQRYDQAKENCRRYQAYMKKLNRLYEIEEATVKGSSSEI